MSLQAALTLIGSAVPAGLTVGALVAFVNSWRV